MRLQGLEIGALAHRVEGRDMTCARPVKAVLVHPCDHFHHRSALVRIGVLAGIGGNDEGMGVGPCGRLVEQHRQFHGAPFEQFALGGQIGERGDFPIAVDEEGGLTRGEERQRGRALDLGGGPAIVYPALHGLGGGGQLGDVFVGGEEPAGIGVEHGAALLAEERVDCAVSVTGRHGQAIGAVLGELGQRALEVLHTVEPGGQAVFAQHPGRFEHVLVVVEDQAVLIERHTVAHAVHLGGLSRRTGEAVVGETDRGQVLVADLRQGAAIDGQRHARKVIGGDIGTLANRR